MACPSSEERTEASSEDFDQSHNVSPESLTMDLTADTISTTSLATSSLQQGETLTSEALGQNTVGSFGATTIKQVPSTTQKPSSNIASLLQAEADLGKNMLSFLVGDAGSLEGKQKELIASGNQLLSSLHKQYPNLPFTIEKWNELSFEQQAELSNQYPSGVLDRVKEVSARATILEAAIALQTTTINKASKTVASLDQRLLPAYMNRPLQNEVRAPNDSVKKYEYADNSILELSRQKETYLAKSIQAAESNNNADLQQKFQHAAKGAEVAIKKFQEFAQKIKEGNPAEMLGCYEAACDLKLKALVKSASASSDEYTKLEAAAANTQQAKNLREAANRADSAAIQFTHAHLARAGGNEKEALAYEQDAAYNLSAAKTYAIGTPDSLKEAENLEEAARSADLAVCACSQGAKARAGRNEKRALAYEQAASYYLQAAEAHAIGTPESFKEAENLKTAAWRADAAAGALAQGAKARVRGNEKSALAYEQAAAYHLQAAEACLIGTPESLKKAENLEEAAAIADTAAYTFNREAEARAGGNEKEALTREQEAAYYIKKSRTVADTGEVIQSYPRAKLLESLTSRDEWAMRTVDEILTYNAMARIMPERPAQAERYEKAAAFLKDQLEKFEWIKDDRPQRFTRMLEAAKKIVNPQQDSCVVM